ncbi:hypothetical protein XBKB1_3820021 [Xenorhabdus bovienii str. kraussei Becker Underwood]|uniref:Uncharacterized protein n=1 Tax=Xenorhabdus bovienii str. kraussei Becker Underwood TaxID=1398204 RepID=A0A077PLH3_XENBV|nr:hypothetical protein XBKB1_3820021 [Xenorhabdus bovienii str. kraussei Becker Underwood]
MSCTHPTKDYLILRIYCIEFLIKYQQKLYRGIYNVVIYSLLISSGNIQII